MLTKNKLECLESIHYMDAQGIREADEKDWLKKFNRLENLYSETGLVRVPVEDRELARWLSNQRKFMRNDSLHPSRKEKLLMLGIYHKEKRRGTRKIIQGIMRNGSVNLRNYVTTTKSMETVTCLGNGMRTLRSVLG